MISIGTITKVDIAEVLRPIWIEKNETAKRIRGRIETIFDYAKAMGYFVGDNPAEWKGNLEPILGNLKQESRLIHLYLTNKLLVYPASETEKRDSLKL